MENYIELLNEILSDFNKIILSNKRNKNNQYNKIEIENKQLKQGNVFQFTKYTDKQSFNENIEDKQTCLNKITDIFENEYKQINAFYNNQSIEIKASKKGKVFISKQTDKIERTSNTNHNREKNYLLKASQDIEPLIDLGVVTKEGKIVNKQYDKFKQINKFIEIIDNAVSELNKTEVNIIDFGCGKSYLTFIVYYYLTKIKNIKANIIGLDLKQEVIEQCNIIALKYKYENLKFEIGDINGYTPKSPVDIVISLHACDTATDYALFNAIKWNVPVILSVPCCQHEINAQINNSFNLLTKYGILKERFSALLTDGLRANLLETQGYKTQILEFIDLSHTPKNILIKAVKKGNKKTDLQELENVINNFEIKPTLYNLLKENGLI